MYTIVYCQDSEGKIYMPFNVRLYLLHSCVISNGICYFRIQSDLRRFSCFSVDHCDGYSTKSNRY